MSGEINLLRRFLKDDKQTDELECFLVVRLGEVSWQKEGVINYRGLRIEYAKDGRTIKAIRSVEPHDESFLSRLETDIHEALRIDHGRNVGEAYFFTHPPVVGVFQLGGILQIIPVPDNAPNIQPNSLGKHPAILQFTYDKSTDDHVNEYRMKKRRSELLLLLNMLLRNQISWIDGTDMGQKEWVWDVPDDHNKTINFTYRQVGYSPVQTWSHRDDLGFFANPDWQKIPREPSADYYRIQGDSSRVTFLLPDSLEKSITRYEQLSDDESALFLRSAHWLAKSSSIFAHSHSLSYVSLVHALEGLIPDAEPNGRCKSCDRDLFDKSISKRFREFLYDYGAGLPPKYMEQMYRLRSAIAHGGGLMPRDREITTIRFTAEQYRKDYLFVLVQMVCQVVLLNWLHSEKRTIIE